ncbi:MAG: lamin tail domain-containing protein [Tannerellaceae bacterium]|jgi:hypothetical protein|nr:lamin tail domain-containing protein [Tannerellaceae bacterium]
MKQILFLWLLLSPFHLFSQLNESFSGTSLISDNPWEGDIDRFVINASGQLQFTSPQGERGSASLYLPLSFQENMTWEMDVKMDFQSSNENNLRIYVYASDTIYIQVGNNTRRVSLYEKDAKNNTAPRITGRAALLDEPYTFVSIRLTLEEGQLWTLYTRKEGEQAFYKEGTYKMASPSTNPQALMIITCRYVKTRTSEYYIDNLKVTHKITEFPEPEPEPSPEPSPEPEPEPEPEPDEYTGLEVLSAEALNERELQFFFNKTVRISEAVCEIENIGEAVLEYGPNQATVKVYSPAPLENGREYVVVISGLYDSDGTPIAEQAWEFLYEKEESPAAFPGKPGQVLINEVMANPKGLTAFPETEYVELYNVSETPVSLEGWIFIYDGKRIAIDMLILPPGGYAVLYRADRPIHVDEAGQSVAIAQFPAALSNTGKLLQLENAQGELIDEFYYPKAQSGISWERLGDDAYLSADARGGTPGSPNSSPETTEEPAEVLSDIEPGEVIFNELLPNPFSGGSEYVELYNRSGRTLSLQSLSLTALKSNGAFGASYPLSNVFPMNTEGYALLTKDKEAVASFYLLSSPESVYELKIPIINNTSSTLVLFRTRDSVVIDQITYSSQWYETFVNNTKGVALERINPDAPTQDADNWTSAAATAGYGTPGYRNSQFMNEGSNTPTNISIPTLMEDGLYHISYQLENPGYRCRLYIYNMAGSLVAEVANHELPGISGEFLWDGKTSAGNRLKAGIYIIFVELYNANGIKKQEKNVFLIR